MTSTAALQSTLVELQSLHPVDEKEQFELQKRIFELQIKVDEVKLVQKQIFWTHATWGCIYALLGGGVYLQYAATHELGSFIFIFAPCFLTSHILVVTALYRKLQGPLGPVL